MIVPFEDIDICGYQIINATQYASLYERSSIHIDTLMQQANPQITEKESIYRQ